MSVHAASGPGAHRRLVQRLLVSGGDLIDVDIQSDVP